MLLLSAILSYAQEKAIEPITVYYLIRHAEKDLANPQNKNPNLTAKGEERAKKWAAVFEEVKFDAVYSTNYYRTLQTATPTAIQHRLEITDYDMKNFNIEAFKKGTQGKTVLIVGHSNTTPMLVNALLGTKKYNDIDESHYNHLYIVTLTTTGATDMLLKID